MRDLHFSLRWMFGFVSFLAVGCGLLAYATPRSSQLTLTAVLVILLGSALAAACHAGERRTFWAGFAAFALAYIWIVCGSWQSPDGGGLLRDRLATTSLLRWCHEKAPHTQSVTAMVQSPNPGMMGPMMMSSGRMAGSTTMGGPMMPGMAPGPGGAPMMGPGPPTLTIVSQAPNWDDFATTGHSLFALAFATLGGLIAVRCYRRGKEMAAK